jgi:hypothetical protein
LSIFNQERKTALAEEMKKAEAEKVCRGRVVEER